MPLPIIADRCGVNAGIGGGWLVGISNALISNPDTQLVICFPHKSDNLKGSVNNAKYYSFPKSSIYKYDKATEACLLEIISAEKPDVIHIFGTEFPHSYAAVNAAEKCGMLEKTVISIQGLVSVYAKHFFAGLPSCAIHKYTLHDLIKHDSIYQQKKKYSIRGKFEIAALKKVKHVIGRTDWDEACIKEINPTAQYHFCNETLRGEFYTDIWKYEYCEEHSVFLGSGSYPIKGFHRVLEILPSVIKEFPNTKLYVPYYDISSRSFLEKLLHKSHYQVYIEKLIKKLDLKDNIVFLNPLSAEEMKSRMLKSNVFILPSAIENSPNTLGEAMLLGLPCIAADVGGVKNMAVDKVEALIYPFDENYLIPLYVSKIFNDCEFAAKLSESARRHAMKTHDIDANNRVLTDIYLDLASK